MFEDQVKKISGDKLDLACIGLAGVANLARLKSPMLFTTSSPKLQMELNFHVSKITGEGKNSAEGRSTLTVDQFVDPGAQRQAGVGVLAGLEVGKKTVRV